MRAFLSFPALHCLKRPSEFDGLRISLLVLLGGIFWASASHAADMHLIGTDEPAVQLITIAGEIKVGDESTFAELAGQAKSAIVVLNSSGGALLPALEIGKTVRHRGFLTYVAEGQSCTSACALIWLGGR